MDFGNHLLDSLAPADRERLEPHLQRARLDQNRILDEPGHPISTVWLPADCLLSVVIVMRNGELVETRTIGRESGYGLLHALGSPLAYERTLVQIPGDAWRAPLSVLAAAADESAPLRRLIASHAQATLVQAAQAAACNSVHGAEQRLCRWLLMSQDRLGSGVLPLTQEHLSIMLGVRRTTVTAIAMGLQARGVISYSRGKIRVLDRGQLVAGACECYEVIERTAAAVLGDSWPLTARA
jgi:CRP-like cAMP-binding protein